MTREPSARRASTKGDLLDDTEQVTLVLELRLHAFERAATFDEHYIVTVDENIGDRIVLEQRLQRAKAKQLVKDIGHHRAPLAGIQSQLMPAEDIRYQFASLGLDLRPRHFFELGEIDLVEQLAVNLHLERKQVRALSLGRALARRSH